MRDQGDRIRVGGILLAIVVVVATAWFALIERLGFLDALYHTVITVSTVGFKEAEGLDASGRAFTIVVILFGVGAAFYTLSGLFERTVEGQIDRLGRRRMEREIERLEGHAIVCGYGRVGAKVAELLAETNAVVVLDRDEDAAVQAREDGHRVLAIDATSETALEEAGAERAASLVAALPADADNLYVVLSARELNPELTIAARAQGPQGERKLRRAGADRVVNPEDIGARRLATSALNPAVNEFFDVVTGVKGDVGYRLEEMEVSPSSRLAGTTLGSCRIRETSGALVVAVKAPDGRLQTNPTEDTDIGPGAHLIAIGTADQIARLADMARG